MTNPAAIYQPLTVCFAIPQSENVDFGQLVLEWAQAGGTAPILLRNQPRSGMDIEINVSPSPSQEATP